LKLLPAFAKNKLLFCKRRQKNNLFYWDISDHEALDPKPEVFLLLLLLSSCKTSCRIRGMLGNKVDSTRYQKLADGINEISSISMQYRKQVDSTMALNLHRYSRSGITFAGEEKSFDDIIKRT
jgi:hypothetical protein